MSAIGDIRFRLPIGGSILLLAAASLTPLGGCGTADRSLVGVWKGGRSLKGVDITDHALAITATTVRLTLKENGRFLLNDGPIPFEGQWSRQGDSLSLDIVTVFNRPISSQSAQIRAAGAYTAEVKGEQIELHDATGAAITLSPAPDGK